MSSYYSPTRSPPRPNSATRVKTVATGKQPVVKDTSSVRDRVRQWQAQGGGVIEADNIGAETKRAGEPLGRSCQREKKCSPRTPSKKHAIKGFELDRCRGTSNDKPGPEKATKDDRGPGIAPAKRVVSDSHWRKKKGSPKSPACAQTPGTPARSWTRSDESLRDRTTNETKLGEGVGRERKESTREALETPCAAGDDGIRVYVTPPGSRRHSGHPRRSRRRSSGSTVESGIDAENRPPASSGEPDPRETEGPYEEPLCASSSATYARTRPKRRSSTRRREGDGSPQFARSTNGRSSTRSQKGNILSQVFGDSRKRLAKQPPDLAVTPRVSSIEAWLHETPDPFLDEPKPADDEAGLVEVAGLERKGVEQQTGADDPNQIWESLDTKEGTRRAVSGIRQKRIPSAAIYHDNPFPPGFDSTSVLSESGNGSKTASKLVDLGEGPADGSHPALRRRAARNSPSSPMREHRRSRVPAESSQDASDTASARSSRVTTSSVEGPDPRNPLKPPGLNIRRPFPSTGQHRLSTIASVETFDSRLRMVTAALSTSDVPEPTLHPSPIHEDDTSSRAEAEDQPHSAVPKRSDSHLTKHADLISMLSMPRISSKSIKSARSIRTNRSRLGTATVEDLMREMATDEGKYMRELRTLVDGVIPVLLSCVLSKSDSAVAAGLFQPSSSSREDPQFTRPIVDMGISLERLKTLHKRVPLTDPVALLTWAHGAQRVYVEYLKAWRMGFQDVVVNLAPATESARSIAGEPGLDDGLPRDANGDVIGGDGEKVDVAFLLKRPLVRLKYLAKTLKGINFVSPSPEAEGLALKYAGLVETARLRANEEMARLEDEGAANIDPTRARDPRTLAPLSGVIIDRTRRVRARDHFNLALQHSSGQRVDCRVELLLRDQAADAGDGGDLLVCEVDASGKWLLFPPVNVNLVSARNGDEEGEIVIMVRGFNRDASEWREILSLRSEDEQAGFEWVQMLGLTPVPPSLGRSHSFAIQSRKRQSVLDSSLSASNASESPIKSRTPSPRELDVPIGERVEAASRQWAGSPGSRPSTAAPQAKSAEECSFSSPLKVKANYVDHVNDLRSLPSQARGLEVEFREPVPRPPRTFKEALGLSGTSAMSGLRRTKAKRLSRHLDGAESSATLRGSPGGNDGRTTSTNPAGVGDKGSGASAGTDSISSSPYPAASKLGPKGGTHGAELGLNQARPASGRRYSVPSLELPHIPRARKPSPPVTPSSDAAEAPGWSDAPESRTTHASTGAAKRRLSPEESHSERVRSSPARRTQKASTAVQLDPPNLQRSALKPRRSSSPLKHEYEPSTASESPSDSDASTVECNEDASMTDSSEDDDLEASDVPTPLMPLDALQRTSKPPPRPATSSTPDGTLKPSDSASQAPYKAVPSQPKKAAKTIASIFSWSDTGTWQSLHPDECSIVITPGLIEAFEMSASHSSGKPPPVSAPTVDPDRSADDSSDVTSQNDEMQSERPLVALELTPLVPLRRGTALDISIRSPPTPNSQITSGSNIMFRSRNPEECEALYSLINHSRIHNPTYIALQNARGPFAGSSVPGAIGRRPGSRAASSRSSWFAGFGRSPSYRASSARTPSIAPSESSVGSMSSTFSALRRFGRGSGGGMFNIALSTITSRNGTGSGANSVCASSDNASGSGTSSPIPPGMTANQDGSLGLKDAKIRLYIRETASRWRDMGSARLTIMRAERHLVGPDARPPGNGGYHQTSGERRIVVHGKTKGEVLLDVQLGESCFERVARTGIAVSVWEDVVGPNGEVGVVGAVGGVAGGKAKVYMIQVRTGEDPAVAPK